MNKRTIVLAMAGAAAVWFGWMQFSKRAAGENQRELPRAPQHDVIRVQASPEIIKLEPVKMPDWEMRRKQDWERNFFEWRDGKLDTLEFAASVAKG